VPKTSGAHHKPGGSKPSTPTPTLPVPLPTPKWLLGNDLGALLLGGLR
jgi:hypothetical protein